MFVDSWKTRQKQDDPKKALNADIANEIRTLSPFYRLKISAEIAEKLNRRQASEKCRDRLDTVSDSSIPSHSAFHAFILAPSDAKPGYNKGLLDEGIRD